MYRGGDLSTKGRDLSTEGETRLLRGRLVYGGGGSSTEGEKLNSVCAEYMYMNIYMYIKIYMYSYICMYRKTP